MHLPPLSLYIHIPWCVRKCPYCDFNSHAAGNALPEAEYISRLTQDLAHCQAHCQGRKLSSIFFGGGTPSLFSARGIEQILATAETLVGFARDVEITLEANPGTFEQVRFAAYRQAGVNRLSIGVQSFQAEQLRALGRIHSAEEAATAVERARAVGFDNINIDLMHGLPNQTLAQAKHDLASAIALGPDHLSWYQLTIEKNTAFYSAPPTLPDDELLADIEELGFTLLHEAGFHQYEVSAFCRDGKRCHHNINYWQFGDYLGIGAGAHGKITWNDPQQVRRSQITRLPRHYLAQPEAEFHWHTVDKAQLQFEFMLNALRLREGVPRHFFHERTHLNFAAIEKVCEDLIRQGLLLDDQQQLVCTASGFRFLNDVVGAFLVRETADGKC